MTENNLRCVVTGLGLISAIGSSVDECWSNALKSVSGIATTTSVDTKDCYASLAAEVKDDLKDVETKEYMDRVSKLCIKATKEAMSDAGLKDFNDDPRVSVIIGSCVGGVVSIEHYYQHGKDKKDIKQMPISAIASQVAGYVHAGGVVTNIANACAAGTISISYACDLIRAGKADIVIAGGADAFASVPYSGFLALHALDSNPCSPFNHCKGITLGEGSGIVVVESYEHALKRKAKIYCEVLGSGVSSDAHHITAPREDGEGQMNAIRWAMKTSGVKANEIGYINAHGTGTGKNDNAEFLSLHTIFDPETDNLSVSSTKAMVGHCLGAAGAIEAVFSIKALTTNTVPATLGYSDEDLVTLKEKAGKIDFIPNKAHEKELENVMSNSFAFGGNNASIIFSKNAGNVTLPEKKEKVVVTGFGIVSPLGNGTENYIAKVNANETVKEGNVKSVLDRKVDATSIPNLFAPVGVPMSFHRKLDVISSIEVASGIYALKDANLEVTDENATRIGIVVGTSEGALGMGCEFEENIYEKGNANGSAFSFPNTVYNAAGGYLSIQSKIKGYNVTITNGAQSGLASIAYGMNIIEQGKEDVILASGSDENINVTSELYTSLGYVADSYVEPYSNNKGFVLSDGGITIVLESETNADKRGAKKYAYVSGYGMTHKDVSFGTLSNSSEALDEAIKQALDHAGLKVSDIDAIVGFGNGCEVIDNEEISSYKRVFGENFTTPVVSTKARTGEGRAASAALNVVQASLLLSNTIDHDDFAYVNENGKMTKKTLSSEGLSHILVTAYGSGGSYTAVILSK